MKNQNCCKKCRWYRTTESEVHDEPDEGGWCTRFPVWENLPEEHYCGEFSNRNAAKALNEYYEK